jgi:hypothetical protein
MLLSEMVRKISKEKKLVEDTTVYSQNSVTDWVTKTTKTVTLNEESIIYFSLTGQAYVASGSIYGSVRVLVDGKPIASTGQIGIGAGGTVTVTGYIVLSAGQHTFEFQSALFYTYSSSNELRITSIKLYAFKFSDVYFPQSDSGTVNAPVGTDTTVLDINITHPQRNTCIGNIKQVPLRIIVYMEGIEYRNSYLRNPGETNYAGALSWKLFINDTQVNWGAKYQDNPSDRTNNMSYGEGSMGFYETLINAGTTINVKVKVYNDTGSARNVRAIISPFSCPWIFGSNEYQPVELSFPQGSTLYMTLEPLTSDPTKTLKLGYLRAVDLGYNYYSSSSGTGIVSWYYTFESVEVSQNVLLVSGNGGCISIIAVDVRGIVG